MDHQEDFQPNPESARAVRLYVAEALGEIASADGVSDDVVLAASELATNVIRHARTDFTVRVTEVDHQIRLEVADGSSILPAVQDLGASHGGLRMIEEISQRWGIESTQTGKTVWVEFATPS